MSTGTTLRASAPVPNVSFASRARCHIWPKMGDSPWPGQRHMCPGSWKPSGGRWLGVACCCSSTRRWTTQSSCTGMWWCRPSRGQPLACLPDTHVTQRLARCRGHRLDIPRERGREDAADICGCDDRQLGRGGNSEEKSHEGSEGAPKHRVVCVYPGQKENPADIWPHPGLFKQFSETHRARRSVGCEQPRRATAPPQRASLSAQTFSSS